jgi:membrane protein YdbS with pleckstrin-like domain
MRLSIILLFVISIIGASIGFYIKPEDPETGNLFIGLSIVLGFFVVMPLFIYHRWKNRSVKDYMLTKESIEKMREFNNSKDKKNNLG